MFLHLSTGTSVLVTARANELPIKCRCAAILIPMRLYTRSLLRQMYLIFKIKLYRWVIKVWKSRRTNFALVAASCTVCIRSHSWILSKRASVFETGEHCWTNRKYLRLLLSISWVKSIFVSDIPVNEADQHSNLAILVTSGGGHVGYLDTFWPFTKNNFMLKLIQQYFAAIMVDGNYDKFVNV